ncbi:MAG TPA: hypothetical protein VF759_14710 [Allosphingosinicella sp.]|jgi:hypothetical protein
MNSLQVPADSPWWLHAAAGLILFAHVAGGTVGLLAGAAALGARKGSRPHRLAGHVFFVSMLSMAATGAAVSPFLAAPDGAPRWFDSLAGTLAFYLVATGWATVRRRPGSSGGFEIAALLFAAAAASAAILLGAQASSRPGGTLAGYGPEGYYAFAGLLAFGAALDLKLVLRGGITGTPRIARHAWRLGTALFIAAAAFFLGQQQVMPEFVRGSLWLAVPPFATLGLMVFWLVKLRLDPFLRRRRRRPAPRPEAGEAR